MQRPLRQVQAASPKANASTKAGSSAARRTAGKSASAPAAKARPVRAVAPEKPAPSGKAGAKGSAPAKAPAASKESKPVTPLKAVKGGAGGSPPKGEASHRNGNGATKAGPSSSGATSVTMRPPPTGQSAVSHPATPAPGKVTTPSRPPPPPSFRPLGAATPGGPMADRPMTPPPPLAQVKFKVGDKAVHPAHGVGEVTAVETREIGGKAADFYVLKILDNGMKVMVPTNAAAAVGLREIMSAKDADAILETMKAREVAVDVQPWSRRFRIYTEMIKSKSPHEVAKVMRDMHRLKFDKDLSFGERRLLDQAKSLLMKELALAKSVTEVQLEAQVQALFSS